MTKLNIIIAFAASAVVACICVEAINLRQHEPGRILALTEASDNGSGDFFSTEESDSSDSAASERNGSGGRFLVNDDTSSSLDKSVDESENGSGLLVEVESSVDGSTVLDSLDTSESTESKTNDDVTDSNDSKDDSEDNADSLYRPGTVKPAPIDGSGVFDMSSLSWRK